MSSESPTRRRVRWLTLAEVVGILALAIAALGWWDSHTEHQREDRDRAEAASAQAASARREAQRATFLLTGSVEQSGERIRLASARQDQVIQTQTLIFPQAVRADPVETTGNPRIERGWFEDGLKKAARDRGDKPNAELRMPLGVITTYVEAGDTKTDRAIYLVAGSLRHRVLRGSRLDLDGLSLVRRGVTGDLRASVDKTWGGSSEPAKAQ